MFLLMLVVVSQPSSCTREYAWQMSLEVLWIHPCVSPMNYPPRILVGCSITCLPIDKQIWNFIAHLSNNPTKQIALFPIVLLVALLSNYNNSVQHVISYVIFIVSIVLVIPLFSTLGPSPKQRNSPTNYRGGKWRVKL